MGAVLRTFTCRPSSRMVAEPRTPGEGLSAADSENCGWAGPGVRPAARAAIVTAGRALRCPLALRVVRLFRRLGRAPLASPGLPSPQAGGRPSAPPPGPGERSQGIYLAGVDPTADHSDESGSRGVRVNQRGAFREHLVQSRETQAQRVKELPRSRAGPWLAARACISSTKHRARRRTGAQAFKSHFLLRPNS